MKKFKNVLILLLSALMLTVFVSCAPEPEVETPAPKDDLIISAAYCRGNYKLVAISNISDADYSLDGVSLVSDAMKSGKPQNDINLVLPNITLAPKCTLFFVHGDVIKDGTPFVNIKALEAVTAESTGKVTNDVYIITPSYPAPNLSFNGEDSLVLMKNVAESTETVGDKEFKVFTGDEIDSVKLTEEQSADGRLCKDTGAIRNFDEAGKPTDWTVYAAGGSKDMDLEVAKLFDKTPRI